MQQYNTSDLSHSCPQNAFKVQLCVSCGQYHALNVNCAGNSAVGVYSFTLGDNAVDERYNFPLLLNGRTVTAMRNSGNNGSLLVHKKWVSKNQILPNRFIYCHGMSEGKFGTHKLQVARVKISCPRLNCHSDILTEVAVYQNMPEGIDCNVGNDLFRTHNELDDIIMVRPSTDDHIDVSK